MSPFLSRQARHEHIAEHPTLQELHDVECGADYRLVLTQAEHTRNRYSAMSGIDSKTLVVRIEMSENQIFSVDPMSRRGKEGTRRGATQNVASTLAGEQVRRVGLNTSEYFFEAARSAHLTELFRQRGESIWTKEKD